VILRVLGELSCGVNFVVRGSLGAVKLWAGYPPRNGQTGPRARSPPLLVMIGGSRRCSARVAGVVQHCGELLEPSAVLVRVVTTEQ
jgi:hypothetical protein